MDLIARDVNPGAWRIATKEFDGTRADYFSQTSMHLRLTDWKVPVAHEETFGQRGSAASLVEAFVSIADAGAWVADVSFFERLEHPYRQWKGCGDGSDCGHATKSTPVKVMKSIETWDDILDCPKGRVVVRCHQNWVARLAVFALIDERFDWRTGQIIVCAEDTCWRCLSSTVRNHSICIF